MHGLNLTLLERAALYGLLMRRPLFKWEQAAITEDTMRSLEEKGLIARVGEQWQVTEKVRVRFAPTR
jgi:hypothetical protein